MSNIRYTLATLVALSATALTAAAAHASEPAVAVRAVQTQAAQPYAAEAPRRLIWGNIQFVRAGNYYEFESELSKTRAEARREMLGELAGLLIPLAASSDDVALLARVMATTVLQFDEVARRHARDVHENISLSLAEDFKSSMHRFFIEHRLNESEQRTGLAHISRRDLDGLSRSAMSAADAVKLVRELRYVAYGSYTVTDRGVVRVVLNLEDLMTARVSSFSAQGKLADVGAALADKVMDYLQGVDYPNWENPQPQLTWIAPGAPQMKVSAQLAAKYCEGQHARLPYAAEMMQAAMGTHYRKGGIGPLVNNATYIVADRNRYDRQYYFSTGEEAQMQTGGPVHTSAGHGALVGYYWCVRGQPSPDTLFEQAVYRLIRQEQRPQVVRALEYVLAQRNDLGSIARVSMNQASGQDAFGSMSAAVQFLQGSGIYLQMP